MKFTTAYGATVVHAAADVAAPAGSAPFTAISPGCHDLHPGTRDLSQWRAAPDGAYCCSEAIFSPRN